MLERGKLLFRSLESDSSQKYYIYCPQGPAVGVVVSVHGISLNAKSHAELLLPFAAECQAVLVAPLFDHERYRDYNTLGFQEGNLRADLTFYEIVQEAGWLTKTDVSKICLCGYSGGAQFAHRYALCYPERIHKLVLCSPGYYTMPDETPYPFGLGGLDALLGTEIDLDAFLSIPMLVMVGEKDVLRNESLLKTEELDRTQGKTRVERAHNWFSAIQRCCRERHIEAEHRLVLLPNVGHGFEISMERTDMGQEIFDFMGMSSLPPAPAIQVV